MIKSFTIINHLGEKLVLELASPEKSGLLVDSVTGLGQVDADVNTSKLAGSDYSIHNTIHLRERNIVFKLKFMSPDAEDDERIADRFFSTKNTVIVICETDYVRVFTSGSVEKNEPIIFSERSGESGCQVSILCPDPYWHSIAESTTIFSGIIPMFSFPFSDSAQEEIQFGRVERDVNKSIQYNGDEEYGILIKIHATGYARDLKIYNVTAGEQFGLNDSIIDALTGNGIMSGDDIEISTIRGQKHAYLTRNGMTYNIMNAVINSPKSTWFQLHSGDNWFSFTTSVGQNNLLMTIISSEIYKGV